MFVKKYFMLYYCLLFFYRDCGEYVCYVFFVGLGVGLLLGFLVVIVFFLVIVRCKKVGKLR